MRLLPQLRLGPQTLGVNDVFLDLARAKIESDFPGTFGLATVPPLSRQGAVEEVVSVAVLLRDTGWIRVPVPCKPLRQLHEPYQLTLPEATSSSSACGQIKLLLTSEHSIWLEDARLWPWTARKSPPFSDHAELAPVSINANGATDLPPGDYEIKLASPLVFHLLGPLAKCQIKPNQGASVKVHIDQALQRTRLSITGPAGNLIRRPEKLEIHLQDVHAKVFAFDTIQHSVLLPVERDIVIVAQLHGYGRQRWEVRLAEWVPGEHELTLALSGE